MGKENEKRQPLYRRVLNGLNVFEQIRRAKGRQLDRIGVYRLDDDTSILGLPLPPSEEEQNRHSRLDTSKSSEWFDDVFTTCDDCSVVMDDELRSILGPEPQNPIVPNTDKPKGKYLDYGYTPPESLEQGTASLSKRNKLLVQKSKSKKDDRASGSPKKWSFGSSLSVDSVTKNTSKSAKERQIAAQPFLALMKVTNGNPMSILKGTKEGDDAKKKKRRKKKRKPKNSNIS